MYKINDLLIYKVFNKLIKMSEIANKINELCGKIKQIAPQYINTRIDTDISGTTFAQGELLPLVNINVQRGISLVDDTTLVVSQDGVYKIDVYNGYAAFGALSVPGGLILTVNLNLDNFDNPDPNIQALELPKVYGFMREDDEILTTMLNLKKGDRINIVVNRTNPTGPDAVFSTIPFPGTQTELTIFSVSLYRL